MAAIRMRDTAQSCLVDLNIDSALYSKLGELVL